MTQARQYNEMIVGGKYAVALAILCGVGFTALIALLLNLHSPIVLLLSFLLVPGGIVSAVIFHTKEVGSPIAALVFNAFTYSAVFYLTLRHWLGVSLDNVRLTTLILTAPVILLASLACVPSMSPIWPRGMEQLQATERRLRDGLPLGLTIDSARSLLQRQGVAPYEAQARNEEVVFQVADKKMTAGAGDTVISAQIQSEALQFPCGFRIDVILVFGNDGILRQEHIERFRLCP